MTTDQTNTEPGLHPRLLTAELVLILYSKPWNAGVFVAEHFTIHPHHGSFRMDLQVQLLNIKAFCFHPYKNGSLSIDYLTAMIYGSSLI